MKYLAASNRKINSLESPIFAHVNNVHQSEINPSIGFDFLTGLNSSVRSDPDVIILSDVPDSEVAASVCRISARCVLVALVNALSASASIVMLREMGGAPSLLSQYLTLALHQRLIRKLCPACSEQTRPTEAELADAGLTNADVHGLNIRKAKGCKECNFIGYSGRIAIFETLVSKFNIAEKILQAPAADIERAAIQDGMVSLRNQCLQKIGEGLTSIEELQRLRT
jgi:type IV pilus assembly protein PilB